MSVNQIVTVPVSSVPTHIVVWQENANQIAGPATAELVELRKRVEELEKMVRSLTQQPSRVRTVADILGLQRQVDEVQSEMSSIREQEEAPPHQSPYFTSTRIQEPVGLSVITTPVSKAMNAGTAVPELKLFNELVEAASVAVKKDKSVNLNGVTFICRQWKGDTIYCEENTGRAYIDPKDAFTNPDEHSIGYWDATKECLEQKVEEEEEVVEEQEEVVEEETPVEEEVVEEEEEEEKAEEAKEEKAESEEVVEEEEEEQAMELEEFEYKGKTYYKDAQDQVYQMDENGDLDDTPIGVWNEQKQKVLKYK